MGNDQTARTAKASTIEGSELKFKSGFIYYQTLSFICGLFKKIVDNMGVNIVQTFIHPALFICCSLFL